jgi:HlyD family secretion protein
MAGKRIKWGRIIAASAALAIVVSIVLALLPSPLKVEVGQVERGPMRVTIDEEGETRARDRFVISAPIGGRVERIKLDDGDSVRKGDVVAVINPTPLGPRESGELLAKLRAAEALSREANDSVARARAVHSQALRELERSEQLAANGVISVQALEHARNAERTSRNELDASRSRAEAAASDVAAARAALIALDTESEWPRSLRLLSPVNGKVLRVVEKSERVVTPGTPLIVLGDPSRMEVVVDLLTTDAVKVAPGATVLLENWGGEEALQARVRLVEASAFTKVSALGVEEQRVNVIADFLKPAPMLGDGFRLEARIVIWESRDTLKVPASAVFRHGEGWSLFLVEDGRAKRCDITAGHRNALEVEVLGGIEESAHVVLHPSNQLSDGADVEPR